MSSRGSWRPSRCSTWAWPALRRHPSECWYTISTSCSQTCSSSSRATMTTICRYFAARFMPFRCGPCRSSARSHVRGFVRGWSRCTACGQRASRVGSCRSRMILCSACAPTSMRAFTTSWQMPSPIAPCRMASTSPSCGGCRRPAADLRTGSGRGPLRCRPRGQSRGVACGARPRCRPPPRTGQRRRRHPIRRARNRRDACRSVGRGRRLSAGQLVLRSHPSKRRRRGVRGRGFGAGVFGGVGATNHVWCRDAVAVTPYPYGDGEQHAAAALPPR